MGKRNETSCRETDEAGKKQIRRFLVHIFIQHFFRAFNGNVVSVIKI